MEKIVIVKWVIKESETARILALLPELAEKTRQEPGNDLYNIYQSQTNQNELILHEQYKDESAAEAHRQSEHYKRIVANLIAPYLEVREVCLVSKLL
jgi:quinol monooxygenase YgiN